MKPELRYEVVLYWNARRSPRMAVRDGDAVSMVHGSPGPSRPIGDSGRMDRLGDSAAVGREHPRGWRLQRWVYIPDKQRYLRVVLLADGQTVHNAFLDRRFRP
jgi:hypothetical protein